jgi:hypothetical protein
MAMGRRGPKDARPTDRQGRRGGRRDNVNVVVVVVVVHQLHRPAPRGGPAVAGCLRRHRRRAPIRLGAGRARCGRRRRAARRRWRAGRLAGRRDHVRSARLRGVAGRREHPCHCHSDDLVPLLSEKSPLLSFLEREGVDLGVDRPEASLEGLPPLDTPEALFQATQNTAYKIEHQIPLYLDTAGALAQNARVTPGVADSAQSFAWLDADVDRFVVGNDTSERYVSADGSQVLIGRGGGDVLAAGPASHELSGGLGNDGLDGGDGDDLMDGGPGRDRLSAGPGTTSSTPAPGLTRSTAALGRTPSRFRAASTTIAASARAPIMSPGRAEAALTSWWRSSRTSRSCGSATCCSRCDPAPSGQCQHLPAREDGLPARADDRRCRPRRPPGCLPALPLAMPAGVRLNFGRASPPAEDEHAEAALSPVRGRRPRQAGR